LGAPEREGKPPKETAACFLAQKGELRRKGRETSRASQKEPSAPVGREKIVRLLGKKKGGLQGRALKKGKLALVICRGEKRDVTLLQKKKKALCALESLEKSLRSTTNSSSG